MTVESSTWIGCCDLEAALATHAHDLSRPTRRRSEGATRSIDQTHAIDDRTARSTFKLRPASRARHRRPSGHRAGTVGTHDDTVRIHRLAADGRHGLVRGRRTDADDIVPVAGVEDQQAVALKHPRAASVGRGRDPPYPDTQVRASTGPHCTSPNAYVALGVQDCHPSTYTRAGPGRRRLRRPRRQTSTESDTCTMASGGHGEPGTETEAPTRRTRRPRNDEHPKPRSPWVRVPPTSGHHLAVAEGFEPSVDLRQQTLSRRSP